MLTIFFNPVYISLQKSRLDASINTINIMEVLGTQGEDELKVSPLTDPYTHTTEDSSTTGT